MRLHQIPHENRHILEFQRFEMNDFSSARIDPLLDRIQADESVPVLARELFAAQAEEYAQLQAQIVEVDAKLMAWHKADECSRRLANIPGIGPIGATH
jgi:transposase